MAKTGKCRCGAVSYSTEGEPAHSSLCWCDDCRASSGSPVVAWAMFERAAVTITGTPTSHESSPGTFRQFCGICGTSMFYLNEAAFPGQIDIHAATFDDRDAFPPQVHIQVADAPAWAATIDTLPKFDRYPEVPE